MINNIVTKKDIGDLVLESFLLKEFSMYGCDSTPGKTIGFNPFSKKCIDITNYQGPEGGGLGIGDSVDSDDEEGVVPVTKKDRPITDVFDSVDNLLEFLKGVYLGAFDAQNVYECLTENTLFSILGAIYGRSAVMLLPKMGYKAAKGTVTGVKKIMSLADTKQANINLQADEYVKRRTRDLNSGFTSSFFKNAKRGVKVALATKKWGLLATGLIVTGGVYGGAKLTQEDFDLSDDIVNTIDNDVWKKGSWRNWECFGAVAVLAGTAMIFGKKAPGVLFKTMKSAGGLTLKSTKYLLGLPFTRNAVEKAVETALKQADTKPLIIFKALQEAGKLPANARLVLEGSSLKVLGLDDVVRISADELPEGFAKLAKDGQIVLDPKVLAKELDTISKGVVSNIDEMATGVGAGAKNSEFYKRLVALRRAAKAGGSAAPAAVRSQAFIQSAEIIETLTKSVGDSLDELFELSNKLIKAEKSVINNLEKVAKIDNSGVKVSKLKDLVISSSIDDVETIILRNFPNLKAGAPDVYKQTVEYYKGVKEFAVAEKNLITDIELSRIALLEESGIVKNLFPGGSQADDLADWLSTAGGAKSKKVWDNLESNQAILRNKAMRKGFSAALGKTVDTLFDNSAFIVSGGALAYLWNSIPDGAMGEPLSVEKVKNIASKAKKILTGEFDLSDYFDVENKKLKTKEYFEGLFDGILSKQTGLDPESIAAIRNFKKQLDNGEFLGSIDQVMNATSGETFLSQNQVEVRTDQILKQILGGRPENLQKEVKQMRKKDIRQLVAEVLNEGYGKYPYHVNEPSEQEPDEDYMIEWKSLVDEVCGTKRKNIDGDPNTFDDATIEVAKILVKDQDLFRDVLEMAGANKSIGVEIMQQLKAAKEKKVKNT